MVNEVRHARELVTVEFCYIFTTVHVSILFQLSVSLKPDMWTRACSHFNQSFIFIDEIESASRFIRWFFIKLTVT